MHGDDEEFQESMDGGLPSFCLRSSKMDLSSVLTVCEITSEGKTMMRKRKRWMGII